MKKINIGLLLIQIAYFIVAIGGTIFAFIEDAAFGFSMLVVVLVVTGLTLSE